MTSNTTLNRLGYTPDNVTELAENEVFVFGSNLAGSHGGGAAKLAREKFGAVSGKGIGHYGQSYAIPTKDKNIETLPLDVIGTHVRDFCLYARNNPSLKFILTEIGCGLAGYSAKDIAPIFSRLFVPANVTIPKSFESIEIAEGEVGVLRCVRKDFTSRDRFQWPRLGAVSAPDWSDRRSCGGGLHGWLKGEGDLSVWEHVDTDVWMVLAVKADSIVDLDGKVKFPEARVVFSGDRDEAVAIMQRLYPTASVHHGTATAGDYGTATAGDYGTATAGDYGTATAGTRGTATAGTRGTATAGTRGIIQISYFDYAANRKRIVIGYIGENGLEPGKKYHLNSAAQFEEVKE